LKDLSIGPILSWNNEKIKAHIDAVLELEGSKLLFGGKPLAEAHNIPTIYGSYQPTAIFVPLRHFRSPKKFKLLTTELFGPFQIVTEYKDKEIDSVLNTLEKMSCQMILFSHRKFLDQQSMARSMLVSEQELLELLKITGLVPVATPEVQVSEQLKQSN